MLDQLPDDLHSPCVGICTLNDALGLCEGCARTAVEIESWTEMDNASKAALWRELGDRHRKTGFGNAMAPLSKRRLAEIVCTSLDDPEATFTVGAYGAVAEFSLGLGEPFQRFELTQGLGLETTRGAIGFRPLSSFKGFAFYRGGEDEGVPELDHIVLAVHAKRAATSRHRGITEVGPDNGALLDDGAEHILFDLGLGAYHMDFCVRTGDPALIADLRKHQGKNVLDQTTDIASTILSAQPDRVVVTQLARIEVRQPIPPQGSATPLGPHTHLSAKLLETGLRHDPNYLLPKTYFPGLVFYPGKGIRFASVLG